MQNRANASIRIMDRARAICEEDGNGFLARHTMWMTGEFWYDEVTDTDGEEGWTLVIQIPEMEEGSNPSRDTRSTTLEALTAKLYSSIPEIKHIMTMHGEKLVDEYHDMVFPNAERKAEAKRIFQEAQDACKAFHGGACVNSVVPVREGYIVDINVYPLKEQRERRAIITNIEDRIKRIPGVLGLSYIDQ